MGWLLLCFGKRTSSCAPIGRRSSQFIQLPQALGASAHLYMAIALLGFGDLFWPSCTFCCFQWHPAMGAVREAGKAPGHRAAGVKAALRQLTKLKTWENESGWEENQVIYSWLKHIPKFRPLEDILLPIPAQAQASLPDARSPLFPLRDSKATWILNLRLFTKASVLNGCAEAFNFPDMLFSTHKTACAN